MAGKPGKGGKRPELQWSKDAAGRLVMPQQQSDYLDWLISSDRSVYENDQSWCQAHDVSTHTTEAWRRNGKFKEEWRKRIAEAAVHPERIAGVLETLHKSATDLADVGAAQRYLTYVEKLMPSKEMDRDPSLASLSDEELVAQVQELIADVAGA